MTDTTMHVSDKELLDITARLRGTYLIALRNGDGDWQAWEAVAKRAGELLAVAPATADDAEFEAAVDSLLDCVAEHGAWEPMAPGGDLPDDWNVHVKAARRAVLDLHRAAIEQAKAEVLGEIQYQEQVTANSPDFAFAPNYAIDVLNHVLFRLTGGKEGKERGRVKTN